MAAPSRLGEKGAEIVEAAESELFLSAASWWELSIKHALGRLYFDAEVVARLMDRAGIQGLAVTFAHAEAAAALPFHHDDPFDRMLVAQAQVESLVLLTRDRVLKAYGNSVLVV